MGAPTIYRNTDTSAPALTSVNDSASLTKLLEACLVDGYGSKSAAGWTLEFENVAETVKVFKTAIFSDITMEEMT